MAFFVQSYSDLPLWFRHERQTVLLLQGAVVADKMCRLDGNGKFDLHYRMRINRGEHELEKNIEVCGFVVSA